MNGDDEARIALLCRDRLGLEPTATTPVAAELGLRRFLRVALPGPPHSVIARIEAEEDPAGRPTGVQPEPPLEPIRALLERSGLAVPRSFAASADGDLILLEDAGSETLEDVHGKDPARAETLLDRVVDDVARLQAIVDPGGVEAFQRHLDAALFAYKADLFATWSLPAALGREATRAEHRAVRRAFEHVAERCAGAPQRLAHRDLQSRNLLVGEGESPVWIDLQGALLAPPEYDLVCLLRDSYVEWPEPVVDRVLARVRPALPDQPTPSDFEQRFALLTLTRKGKDHARFCYVAETRGDARALEPLPTTVRHLQRAARAVAGSHPDLEPLAGWIEALPQEDPPEGGRV